MSVEATPAREFTLAWVGPVGALEDDPLDRKQVRIRGEVARITPTKWYGAQNLKTLQCAVWLYGEAINWAYEDETWIKCEFEDAAAVEKLRSGQIVAIEGRYRQSPIDDIRVENCRLLAAGTPPEDSAESAPLISMKQWHDAANRLEQVRASNRNLNFREGRGLLELELDEALFEETDEFPKAALDAVAGLPIDAVQCPGNGAQQFLAVVQQFPRLRELSFKGNLNCSPADFEKLKQAKYLASLNLLKSDSINDEFAKVIAGLTSVRSLTLEKGLRGYQLTDAGLGVLAGLKGLRSLRFNSYDKITDESLSQLADLPKLRQLSILYTSPFVSKGGISDAGLAALSPDSLPELLFLNLRGQHKLTDTGIGSLIEQKRHLASLDLERTAVTDVGLKRIIEAQLADRLTGLPQDTGDEVRRQLVEARMIREN